MTSKSITIAAAADEAAQPETAIRAYLEKIDRSLARNKRKQARIDRLKAETREILARLKAQMR